MRACLVPQSKLSQKMTYWTARPTPCLRRPCSKVSINCPAAQLVMLKITLPEQADFYTELVKHPKVLKVVALSGGYSRLEGNDRLRKNHGLVAGFSRALVEGLVPRRCKKLPRGMELGNLPTWANCYRARQAEKEEQRPLRDSPSGTAATNPAEFDLQPKARRI
jgi:hypothetical protein